MSEQQPRVSGFAAFVELAAQAGDAVLLAPSLVPNSAVIEMVATRLRLREPGEFEPVMTERFLVNGIVVTLAPT